MIGFGPHTFLQTDNYAAGEPLLQLLQPAQLLHPAVASGTQQDNAVEADEPQRSMMSQTPPALVSPNKVSSAGSPLPRSGSQQQSVLPLSRVMLAYLQVGATLWHGSTSV